MKNLILLTGTSRGLGFYLAHQFLEAGFTVIGIARSNTIRNSKFHFLKLDLAKTKNIQVKLSRFLLQKKISFKNDHVILINNAATVLPINTLHNITESEIQQSYSLNLHAPIILSHFIIQKFLTKSKHISICNISSGAALHPIINWSLYCTMKSGLKMFTDCLQLDYADSNKVKAFSFYPGVMDTKMQETIRKQPKKKFKNVEVFRKLKANSHLLKPKSVAKVIFILVQNPTKIDKTEYSIKDFTD